jgi:two-component system, OmpR family, response regulator
VTFNRTILIVDDEEEICDLLVFEFATRGWQTRVAAGGDAAWEILSNEPIDAVVTDIRMPAGDGLSLLDRLTQRPDRPIVVLTTGYADLDRTAARGRGADGMLTKPFDTVELVGLVEGCLQARAAQKGGG